MNPVRISQSTVQQTVPSTGSQPTGVEQQPKTSLNLEARASQSQILKSFTAKPLADRKITVDNLISKDGFKAVLGKASRHANVKDAMMRAAYTLTAHKKADAAFGSLHKASLRLADHYHSLAELGAPESEKLKTLRELKDTLGQMQEKHIGTQILKGKSYDEASKGPIKEMINFVDVEIARQPSEHVRVAKEMMTTGYSKIKDNGSAIVNKVLHLNVAREHLLAAEETSGLDPEATRLLEEIDSEIERLEEHAPFQDELAKFVQDKDKNLKHVITRQSDPVADMHAERLQREAIEEIESEADFGSVIDHYMVGLDIQRFDKSMLRHVKTEERTGLEHAKKEFFNNSIDDMVTSMFAEDRAKPEPPIIRDPLLTDLTATSLNSDSFSDMGEALAKAINEGDTATIDRLANELGQIIGADISQCSKDVQLGFATSRGEDLKNELLHILALQTGKQLPELAGNYSKASDTVRGFLDKAYATALTKLDNRLEGDTLHLNGLAYTKSKALGEGGNATVSIYTATDSNGKTHQIVVKEPKISGKTKPEHRAKIFDSVAQESRAHRSASEGDNPNIVPFRGAVQTPDGRLLIAMDLAPNGDVDAFSNNLSNAIEKNLVPPHVANLVRITLLKDMANGLRHLQESRGMTHIDIKPQNYFINADGVTQLGDFGLADTALERTFHDLPLHSPDNTSSDIAVGDEDRLQTQTDIQEAITRLNDTIAKEVPKLPAKQQAKATKQIKEQIEKLTKISKEQTFTVTEKADTFSLGMAAYGLLTGGNFVDSIASTATFNSERLDALAEYGNSDQGGKLAGTGVGAIDRVLNGLLDPDPASRLSMTDLLNLSLFSEPGVGSDDVRDVIKLLADPNVDPAKLKEACDKIGVM